MAAVAFLKHFPEPTDSDIDDNITNVVEAHRAGFDARWATWGYNTAANFELARARSIRSVDLASLAQLTAPGAA